ncbi:MAG: ectoine hydroxylase [Verrucomicrobiales bacterium]|jgi:ectoine hydroxylase
MASILSDSQTEAYEKDGYVFARGLFTSEETECLGQTAHNDQAIDQAATKMDDGQGNAVRLSLWNHPGDGIYGMFPRCRRMVDSVEALLGEEVYHYHSKMILKDAKVGGAWAWHQDYGYWYQNGLLFPNLCSVMIAVDKATRENGCLQVLKGSHKLGRVNHILSGDQAGADREYVAAARERLETVYCEMEPGDALFFHANTLHASDANNSDAARWALICCYNARSNNPFKESHHPSYTPLEKVDDSMVLEVGQDHARRSKVEFTNLAEEDKSAKSLAASEM